MWPSTMFYEAIIHLEGNIFGSRLGMGDISAPISVSADIWVFDLSVSVRYGKNPPICSADMSSRHVTM